MHFVVSEDREGLKLKVDRYRKHWNYSWIIYRKNRIHYIFYLPFLAEMKNGKLVS